MVLVKNVLIISYFWSPSGAVGAIRPAKIAKLLSQQGWNAIIVTVKERYYEELNPVRDEKEQTTAVIRTKCFGNPRLLYVGIKSRIFRFLGRENEFKASILKGPIESRAAVRRNSFWSATKRLCLSMVHIPDEQQGWFPFAIPTCLRVVRQKSIDCVISTGPPFTSHLVALVVKKLTGVSWIAEFRDPWSGNEQQPSIVRSFLSDALNQRLEAAVIRNADRVVCVTPAMTDHYRKAYSRLPADKWVTITNGFDQGDFQYLGPIAPHVKFTISYLGSLIYARSPETVLRAVGELVREGEIESNDLAVKFIGKCRYAGGRAVSEMAAEYGLSSVAEVVDFLPRCEALKEMLRAHVLLLLANQQALQVPGKAYEYLGTGRKILAVTEEKGATADFIESVGGYVATPDDHASIKRIVKKWYFEYKKEGKCGTRNVTAQGVMDEYEWQHLGRQYAEALNSCLR